MSLLPPHRQLLPAQTTFPPKIYEIDFSEGAHTGEYTRLTRFFPGADMSQVGGKTHPDSEEVFIVSGHPYDAFDPWLEAGQYANRPPGEAYGPFKTDMGCVVLEVSFPNRAVESNRVLPDISQWTINAVMEEVAV